MTRAMNWMALAALVVCLTPVASPAQQSSTTETKAFEVLAVAGNDLVVRLPEGTRELTVPADFRFSVDGQQLSVHELTVGMKGTATITTRTTVTPVTVTEVKNGTVMQVTGGSIVVRTDSGIKSFSQGDLDKRGVKLMRDGKVADLSNFHQGDILTATIVTSKPPTVMTEKQVQAVLATAPAAVAAAPPAVAAAPARTPAALAPVPSAPAVSRAPSPAPQDRTAEATTTLPKTASAWPQLALASMLSLAVGLILTLSRRAIR